MPDWPWRWFGIAFLVCLVLYTLFAFAMPGCAGMMQLSDRDNSVKRVELDPDGTLKIYTKKMFRPEVLASASPLADVVAVTWMIEMFDRAGTYFVDFWDRDPHLSLGLFGLMPADPHLEPLASIPVKAILASPDVRARLSEHLARRITDGTLICNIDPWTFDPNKDALPPPEPGISFDGRRITRSPNPHQ